ncbi:MAG: hypothetical protein DRQ40_03485 [Gammaproteobacteria bacterium]|nr:MAG: hypothetical protein DRQ40_03485 [Gammaproteobacteria bacterium]
MENQDFIPIYEPFVAKNQKKYVLDCLNSNWISSRGKYVDQFEEVLQKYLGVRHVLTVSNGSVSLMLILKALGIGPGDEVITQSLTYAATVSSIENVGAIPVLVDSDGRFQMNLSKVKKALSKKTKAVMVAQLYGDSPSLVWLKDFCTVNKIHLIEDSAECFGSKFLGKSIGSHGIASSFSFFGNKIVTTGEGGCVCTDDDDLAYRMRLLKSQSHIGGFKHDGPGYNFRMTNIQAAIGVAQMEHVSEIIEKKKKLAKFYREHLDRNIGRIVPQIDSSEWMPLFTLPRTKDYLKFHIRTKEEGIDIRPCFSPVHQMNGFNFRQGTSFEVCEKIHSKGFNLPSGPNLTKKDLKYIVDTVNEIIKEVD